MLSPNLANLNRDAFLLDEELESTVQLAAHLGESGLDELHLDEDNNDAA